MDVRISRAGQNFKFRVGGIIKRGDKYLVVRINKNSFYCLIGGHVQVNEDTETAVVREIKEELSADINVGKLLHTIEWDYPQFHLTMHCYMCSLTHDALHLNEHEAAKWLDSTTLHSVKWLPADEILMPLLERELQSGM